MPRSTNCYLGRREVSIDEALRLRDDPERRRNVLLDFRCVDCGNPVRPHKDSKTTSAHFEHHRRNAACPLSDPQRR